MGDSMRATVCLLCAAGLLLAGCGRALHSVAGVAENARTATEQMASASEASNASREVLIYPEASTLRGGPSLALTQRYETREGPDGFMIYDTETHTIARIGNQTQSGLTMEQAKKAADALSTAASHAGQ
ncbi:MAG: hypothetical protein JWR47_2921 [Phenylobacterium sp.]|jgi:hypothetical protein|nr:hypothetical protein [Phenylobacterium sp.]MDB5436664.1 hypothetical protein [Phenylobacterium sp.]MDB5465038.1 hypothetical protein [Phenylobacterium sp.]